MGIKELNNRQLHCSVAVTVLKTDSLYDHAIAKEEITIRARSHC